MRMSIVLLSLELAGQVVLGQGASGKSRSRSAPPSDRAPCESVTVTSSVVIHTADGRRLFVANPTDAIAIGGRRALFGVPVISAAPWSISDVRAEEDAAGVFVDSSGLAQVIPAPRAGMRMFDPVTVGATTKGVLVAWAASPNAEVTSAMTGANELWVGTFDGERWLTTDRVATATTIRWNPVFVGSATTSSVTAIAMLATDSVAGWFGILVAVRDSSGWRVRRIPTTHLLTYLGVAASESGSLLIAYLGFVPRAGAKAADPEDYGIVIQQSSDLGATWTAPVLARPTEKSEGYQLQIVRSGKSTFILTSSRPNSDPSPRVHVLRSDSASWTDWVDGPDLAIPSAIAGFFARADETRLAVLIHKTTDRRMEVAEMGRLGWTTRSLRELSPSASIPALSLSRGDSFALTWSKRASAISPPVSRLAIARCRQ